MAGELIQDELNPGEGNEFDNFIVDNAIPKSAKPVADQPVNEFDDIVIELEDEKSSTAGANLYGTKGVSPDQSAKNYDLANKTGLPYEVVESEFDSLIHDETVAANADMAAGSKGLQKYLADPVNAKISSDDVGELSAVETGVKDTLFGALYKQTVENFGDRLQSAFGGIVQKAAEDPKALLAGKVNKLTAEELKSPSLGQKFDLALSAIPALMFSQGTDLIPDMRESVKQWGVDVYNDAQDEIAGNLPVGLGPVEQFIVDGVTAMQDMAIAIGTGMITKNPQAALSVIGTQVYANTYADSIKQGLDPARASGRALFHTFSEVIPETIPVVAILRKGSPILKRYFEASVGEAVQEMLTSVLQDSYDDVELNQMTIGEALNNLDWTKVARDGLLGLFVGTGLTVTTQGIQKLIEQVPEKSEARTEAEQNVENYKQLKDKILASKTFQRQKEKFGEFVDSAVEDETDPNVYLDAANIATFFQSRDESPQEIMEKLGVSEEAFGEATASGGDVKVSISKFAGLADTEYYDAFLQDLRTNQGDNTLREEVTAEESRDVEAEATKIVKERVIEENFQAEVKTVRDALHTQLTKTNKFTPDTVEKKTALYEAFLVTQAKAEGITPMELAARTFDVKVQAVTTPVEQNKQFIQDVRKFRAPAAKRVYGQSLLQFLKSKGGLADEGGELSVRDATKLVKKGGMSFDSALEAAVQAGYIVGDLGQLTHADLLEAIDSELGGAPIYSDVNVNQELAAKADQIEQARDLVAQAGLDLTTATDQEINDILFGETAETAPTFRQEGEDGATLEGIEVEELSDEEFKKYFPSSDREGNNKHEADFSAYLGGQIEPGFIAATTAKTAEGYLTLLHRGANTPLAVSDFNKESLGKNTGHGPSGFGVFSTVDPTWAAGYGAVESFHVDIRNPLHLTTDTLAKLQDDNNLHSIEDHFNYREKLRAEGYDGIILDFREEGTLQYVVFDPSQIIKVPEEKVFFQSEQAQRNHMNLWSKVEQSAIDMKVPAWMAKPKKVLTDEERVSLAELEAGYSPAYTPELKAELAELSKKRDSELASAKGTDIWAKMKTEGLKKEELDWLGIEDFLKSKDKFTRDEVVSFVRNNGVEIDETLAEGEPTVSKFDFTETIWDDSEAWDNRTEDLMSEYDEGEIDSTLEGKAIDKIIEDEDSYIRANFDFEQNAVDPDLEDLTSDNDVINWVRENFADEIRNEYEVFAGERAEEEYMQDPYTINYDETTDIYIFGNDDVGYTISTGGPGHLGRVINEGEAVYSFGEAQIQAEEYTRDNERFGDEEDVNVPKWSEYTAEGDHENYRELKLRLPELEGKGHETEFVYDAHFPDANIVTFLRLTDRDLPTEVEGEESPTYFIDEFQSDWHQQGRQHGYQTDATDAGELDAQANEIRSKEVTPLLTDVFNKAKGERVETDDALGASAAMAKYKFTVGDKTWHLSGFSFEQLVKDFIENKGSSTLFAEGEILINAVMSEDTLATLKEKYAEIDSLMARAAAQRGGVMDAPFKGDGWITLGLKRALVDAVEQGKDSFAWIDSNVLTDRWSDRYANLYQTQYDKKMPSIVKKLTKQNPIHLALDGSGAHEHQELGYWTIPLTDELKARIKNDGFALFQKKKGKDTPKAQIQFPDNNEAIISLFETSDLSSFLHESGHLFLQSYIKLAKTSPRVQKELDAIVNWMGVADASEIGVEQHEMFAEGFENYLHEGKAPSTKLQDIFNSFRQWLIQVYKGLVPSTRANLNDEIRGVMDRMLATDEAIMQAETTGSLLPLYTDAVAAGMTEDEYTDYKQSYERATNAARVDTDAELLARLKREQTEVWKKERDSMRDEVLDALYSLPAVQARWFFMRGTLPNGDAIDGLKPVKLSRDALTEMYGDGPAALWRELPFGKYSVWTKEADGVHPDEVAAMFGFANGDAMVQGMVNTKGNLNKIATEEADMNMRSKYGDPSSDEAIAELALETVQNQERSNFLGIELRALEKRAGMSATPRSVIKRAAERIINGTRVSDIKEQAYLRTSYKWARKAVEFAEAQQFEEAADAKRKQLLNQSIYQEALNARKYVDVKTRFLKKFDSPGVRKNLARDYLDQIDSVLEAYDLKKTVSNKEIERRKSLASWIDAQTEQGLEVILPRDLIERARRRSYKDLPLEEFKGLVDSVKNIEHIAKFKQQLIVGKQKRDFNELITDLVDIAVDKNKMKVQKIGLKTELDKKKSYAREVMASHVKMEFLMQQLDGNNPNGLWWNSVFRPIAEAEDAEIVMSQEYMKKLNDIFELYGAKGRAGLYKEVVPGSDIILGRSIKRAELISIALNWGNEGNRKALMRGEDWTAAQINKVLNENMTEADWNTVQSSWDLIDSLWPQISALQKELTGVVPAKVEATPVSTEFGTFTGGYYPLQYDVERNIKAFKYEEKMTVDEMFGGNFTMPSTRQGHTIERVGSDGMAVKLDLDVLGAHIVNVIHDITHRKAVMQADHILQNKQVAEVIISATSRELYQHIRPWLAGVASDKRPFSGWIEQAVGRLRRGATAVNMGWKFTTAIVQPLGYLQSVELLGAKYSLIGLSRFYGNPAKSWNVIQEVFSKSTMMANRSKTFDRDVRDAIKRIKGDTYADKLQRSLFSHIGFMDYSVSIPTWIGGYEKNMAEQQAAGKTLNEADAIVYADSVVRMSQSAGGAKDLAAIQRGGELNRAFTMFYSYFSVLHNLIRRRAQESGKGGVTASNVTATTMSMLYLVVLPAVLAEIIVGRGPDEDEDEEFLPWAANVSLAYPFMTMVGFRDAANVLSTGYSYQATPILDAVETTLDAAIGIKDTIFDEDKEFDRNDVKNIFMTTGYLYGLPARQLYTSGEHLYSVLNDEEEFSLYEFLYRNKRD